MSIQTAGLIIQRHVEPGSHVYTDGWSDHTEACWAWLTCLYRRLVWSYRDMLSLAYMSIQTAGLIIQRHVEPGLHVYTDGWSDHTEACWAWLTCLYRRLVWSYRDMLSLAYMSIQTAGLIIQRHVEPGLHVYTDGWSDHTETCWAWLTCLYRRLVWSYRDMLSLAHMCIQTAGLIVQRHVEPDSHVYTDGWSDHTEACWAWLTCLYRRLVWSYRDMLSLAHMSIQTAGLIVQRHVEPDSHVYTDGWSDHTEACWAWLTCLYRRLVWSYRGILSLAHMSIQAAGLIIQRHVESGSHVYTDGWSDHTEACWVWLTCLYRRLVWSYRGILSLAHMSIQTAGLIIQRQVEPGTHVYTDGWSDHTEASWAWHTCLYRWLVWSYRGMLSLAHMSIQTAGLIIQRHVESGSHVYTDGWSDHTEACWVWLTCLYRRLVWSYRGILSLAHISIQTAGLIIQRHVESDSHVYTGGWSAYNQLNDLGYKHFTVVNNCIIIQCQVKTSQSTRTWLKARGNMQNITLSVWTAATWRTSVSYLANIIMRNHNSRKKSLWGIFWST